MISASATHPGLVRQNNEDSIRTDDSLGIYLLADGIGGHNAGEVASALAVDTVYMVLRSNIAHVAVDGYFELMVHAMHAAHWEINSKAQTSETFNKMGTTLVIALVRENKAYVVNAGDSRCYLFQGGSLSGSDAPPMPVRDGDAFKRLTHDHTVGDQLLARGVAIGDIPTQQFHTLTQSIGCGNPPYPDFSIVELKQGDLLMMCSDGLTDMLAETEIEAILAHAGAGLDTLAKALIDAANERGGRDNISVVLVAFP
ncbi:MAG: protein phosphatase 2C domain-containing protein [Desulfuromonadaceae bacterium]|nr:protein phosphatase 2C domain-containing protein [Desulfuromonadaceae bacterium]MDD2849063.1 protein phosphatase 2C domain-containing protein [Desulfuromonadaceae bacterium]MDD4131779.1 protein phosphatase 2C domain-containing protein [Desulfuromonadaceae bacterium]